MGTIARLVRMYHFSDFSKEVIMKRDNLTVKKIAVIAVIAVFIIALVYVAFCNVEVAETVVEQPITVNS